MKIFITVSFIIACISSSVFAQSAASDSVVIDVSNVPLNQDNPSVAISKKDKSVIVIGASSDFTDMDNSGIASYVSIDTGKSWTENRLPLPLNHQDFYIYGEPCVKSDDAGNFYYAYILNDGADSSGNISFATSTDGKNWKNATVINNNAAPNYGNPDGIDITIDISPSSPHHGRVYAVWDQFYKVIDKFIDEGLYISWSDNQCMTWSTPIHLGSSDDYQFVRTGKHGEIYVAVTDTSGTGDQLYFSSDGGTTFTNPLSQVFTSYPFFKVGADSGLSGLKGIDGFPAFPYPSFDVDLNSGRIYGIYGTYEGDVATLSYSYSNDNGTTWSFPPQIVGLNLLDSADRFDPCVSVDQTTGAAYLLYYSSESDPKNIFVAPYRMLLSDVLPDKSVILSSPFNPLIVEKTDSTEAYIGDHTTSDANGGVYAAAWTQNRAGFTDADIYAFISFVTAKNSVEMPIVIHSQSPWLSVPYPNPCDGKSLSLSYYIPHSTQMTLALYDEMGNEIKDLDEKVVRVGTFREEFALGNIPDGTYFIRMVTVNGQVSQKFVVHK